MGFYTDRVLPLRVEDYQVGIAADRYGPFLRIEPEDPARRGRGAWLGGRGARAEREENERRRGPPRGGTRAGGGRGPRGGGAGGRVVRGRGLPWGRGLLDEPTAGPAVLGVHANHAASFR